MEDFTWLLVSRMFIPLVEPVQPHNWEVFEWSPEFWARMGSQPTPAKPTKQSNTPHQPPPVHPAQPVDHASQVKPLTATEQACHDADAIGVFGL